MNAKAIVDWTWSAGFGSDKVYDVYITDSTGRDIVKCHFNYATKEQADKHAKIIEAALGMTIT